jgi:hypothetical protein
MRLQAYVYLGWTPRLAVVPNGTNQVLQVVGWDGGSGTAPATGLYVGSTGYVSNITDGVNIKGAAGGGGGAAQSFAGGNTFGNTFLANNGTVGWYAGNNISLSLDSLGQNATIIGNTPVVFSNANGVTFGTNAGTVTASVNTNYQSQGAYLTTAMASNAGSNFAGLNSAITNGAMTYNSSGLSLNLSNLLTTAMQSNAGSNFVNTSQSSLFQQTSAMSNYLTTAMLSNAGSNFAGTNGAITGGSMTLNSSGLSINMPNYLTTAMQSNAATISNINISAGTTSGNLSAFTLANSNGVSFGLSNGVITGTVATNYQSQGAYLTTAMQSNASSVFAGTGTTFSGTNVSGSMTLNSNGLNLALSAGAGGGSVNFSAGTTSNNLNAITFSNANGVSFGLNGSVMTGSVAAAGGAQTGISGISAGTTILTAGTLSFGNSNGITFGLNGSVITGTVATNYQSQGAYLTTAMQSNAATISNINVSAGTTSGNLSALTYANSNGVSFGLNNGTITATVATNYQSQGAYLTTAMQSNAATISNINLSAGTTSSNISAFVFSNSNNVSFGLTNGSQVTASASFPAQTVQPMYYSASGTSSSSGTIQFGNTQGVSFSLSNGSIVGSVATNYQSQGAYLTTAMVSNAGSNFVGLNTAITGGSLTANSSGISINIPAAAPSPVYIQAGTTNGSLGTISFANSNGVSFGLNGSTITASAAGGAADGYNFIQIGTTGTLGASFSTSQATFFFNGISGLSVSQTSNTINFIDNDIWYINGNTLGGQSSSNYSNGLYFSGGNNITISNNGSTLVFSAAAGGAGVTINDYQPYQLANSTYTSLANTSPLWLGIYPQENVSMSVVEMISSLSFSSYSSTWNKGYTVSYGMYSQNGASTSLMGSSSMAMLISASSSATFGITLSQGTNSTTFATANSSYSALTGQKIVQMPFSTSLAAGGNYFFGMISSSSSAGSNVNATVSYIANNAMTNASLGFLKPNSLIASAASVVHEPFGFGYTAGTAAFPTNFQASQMSVQSNLQPYVFFEN